MKIIDISEHNGKVNLLQARNSGYDGVIIKASEGTTYRDSKFDLNYAEALRAGMKIGFYCYLKETSAPETQAETFHEMIKDKQNDLIAFLDVEDKFKNYSAVDLVNRFMKRWKQLSNIPIGIYTGNSYANEFLSDASLNIYKVWIANYSNKPFKTNTWGDSYVGWQYTEKGSIPGITGNVDISEFNNDVIIRSGKPYIVSNYMKSTYDEFDGVDDANVHKYTGPYNIYWRSNEKGLWFETQRMTEEEAKQLKNILGSWCYAIQY